MTGLDDMTFIFWRLGVKPAFSLSWFTIIRRLFSFAFCLKVGVCVCEVVDISTGSLDSSLCSIQPGVSHDVLCM